MLDDGKIQARFETLFNFEDSARYGKKVKRLEGKFEKLYFRLLYCKVDIWKSSLCRTRRYLIESLGNNNFGNFLSLPPVSIEILFENKHWQFSGFKRLYLDHHFFISLYASSRVISSKTMPHTEFSWNNPLWGSTWGQIFYLGETAQAFF